MGNNSSNNKKIIIVSVITAIIVIGLWGASWWLIVKHIDASEQQGQFGDMFGAVNALFSGLAFAGLIITLIFQQEELKLQRDELKEQREEMTRQREEFEEQNVTLKRQNFETTFFNMMNYHLQITSSLEFVNDDGADMFTATGKDIFKKIYLERNNFTEPDTYGLRAKLRTHEEISSVLEGYAPWKFFNHYFRSFDNIVSFVNQTDLVEENSKFTYLKMLTCTLTDCETAMLFYHYVYNDGGWHKQMAESYALFYHLDVNQLAKPEHRELFEHEAYDHIVMP